MAVRAGRYEICSSCVAHVVEREEAMDGWRALSHFKFVPLQCLSSRHGVGSSRDRRVQLTLHMGEEACREV